MDLVTLLGGIASGLIVGVLIGWYGHVLGGKRAKEERKAIDELQTIDRCIEVLSAQIRYVIAADTRTPDSQAVKLEYHDVYRRYWYARPEILLAGTDEWTRYKEAERRGRDKSVPVNERINDIRATSNAVFDSLATRRAKLLK